MTVNDRARVAVRGTFRSNSTDIHACDWAATCASQGVHRWAAEAGPATPAAVCGEVATSPFLFAGSTHPAGIAPEELRRLVESLESSSAARKHSTTRSTTGSPWPSIACPTLSKPTPPGCPSNSTTHSRWHPGPDWQEAGTALGGAAAGMAGKLAVSEISDPATVTERGLRIVNLACRWSGRHHACASPALRDRQESEMGAAGFEPATSRV